jgi:hypothetical protein
MATPKSKLRFRVISPSPYAELYKAESALIVRSVMRSRPCRRALGIG